MALWNYDPFSDFCCQGRRCPWRERWGYFQPERVTRWADTSPIHALLSHGFLPSISAVEAAREVVNDKDKYQVTLDLGDFKSNEINVKVVDNSLEICAEHEEKPDEYGHIFRCIKRRYFLPRNVDFDNLKATFSDDGNLVVCAQKKAIEAGKERQIEIQKLPAESKSQPQISQKTEQGGAVCCGAGKGAEKGKEQDTGKKEEETNISVRREVEGAEKGKEQDTGKKEEETNIPVRREVGAKN